MSRGEWIVLAVLVGIGIAASWSLANVRRQAELGAGFVAKVSCSCVFVAERDLAECRADQMKVMEPVEAEVFERNGEKGVRAWVSVLVERRAFYSPRTGCTLR